MPRGDASKRFSPEIPSLGALHDFPEDFLPFYAILTLMEVTLALSGDIPVFRLSGRLDATSSPALEERIKPLLEAQGKKLVFDCGGLTYVSSAGLRVFLSCQRHLSAQGGGVAFSSLSAPVRDLFQLAGLVDLFVIESTAEEAAARLG